MGYNNQNAVHPGNMWLTIHTCRLQCDYSAKAALSWWGCRVDKPPPQERKHFQSLPDSSSLFSSSIIFLETTRSITNSVYRASYCVWAYSALLCAPTHASTCPILLRVAHLSTPRNNFAESHGVIRKRDCDWLGRNTTQFLELAIHTREWQIDGPITGGDEGRTRSLAKTDETFMWKNWIGRLGTGDKSDFWVPLKWLRSG